MAGAAETAVVSLAMGCVILVCGDKIVRPAIAGKGVRLRFGEFDGASQGSVSPSPAVTIIVDVAGEVEQPGVYEFAEGDRVIDAIERAGGQLPKADLSLLNLAAPLTDGTQILVPKAGPPGVVGPGGGTAGSSGGLININSASATELETLSGIGEVLAATIVEYREQNGPFASVDDLMDVSGIGPATLEEIRDQVTV